MKVFTVVGFIEIFLVFQIKAASEEKSFEQVLGERNAMEVRRMLSEDPEIVNRYFNGYTPIHMACIFGFTELLSILMHYGADLNAKDTVFGYTPLHYAVIGGGVAMLKKLLKGGANPNVESRGYQIEEPSQDIEGSKVYATVMDSVVSPLHLAFDYFREEIILTFLTESGSDLDINMQDPRGESYFHRAMRWGNQVLANAIADHRPNLGIRNHAGQTVEELFNDLYPEEEDSSEED